MHPTPPIDPSLTTRELQVVELIVAGLSNAEIASELGISKRTVHAHVANAARKLAVRTRTQLAVAALRLRLVPLDHEGEERG